MNVGWIYKCLSCHEIRASIDVKQAPHGSPCSHQVSNKSKWGIKLSAKKLNKKNGWNGLTIFTTLEGPSVTFWHLFFLCKKGTGERLVHCLHLLELWKDQVCWLRLRANPAWPTRPTVFLSKVKWVCNPTYWAVFPPNSTPLTMWWLIKKWNIVYFSDWFNPFVPAPWKSNCDQAGPD